MRPSEKSTSPAVVRAVQVLDRLAAAPEGLSLAALARTTGFPKSSLHGICETLVGLGVAGHRPDGSLCIGPHVMSWANAFGAQANLLAAFNAAWGELTVFKGETVTLSVLDDRDVVYLACQNSERPLGITFRIGMRLPAPYTATGKAMLSTLPRERLISLFQDHWPLPLTRTSVGSRSRLLAELKLCRQHGYSIDEAQMCEGITCFGAPVFDSSMAVAVAGVSVSFMTADLDRREIPRIGTGIRQLADRLSLGMGAMVTAAAGGNGADSV